MKQMIKYLILNYNKLQERKLDEEKPRMKLIQSQARHCQKNASFSALNFGTYLEDRKVLELSSTANQSSGEI